MLQEARTNLIILEPLEDLIASEPWSMEIYAESLMDELFADIDQILSDRSDLSSPILQSGTQTAFNTMRGATHQLLQLGESLGSSSELGKHIVTMDNWLRLEDDPKSQPLEYATPSIVLPQKLIRHVPSVPQVKSQQFNTLAVDTPVVGKVRHPHQKWWHTLGKLLSIGIPISIIISTIVWALHSGLLNRLIVKSYPQSLLESKPQLPTTATVEANLVNYILGALAAIDRQETNYRKSSPTDHTAYAYLSDRSTGNLSPLSTNNIPTPNHSTTVVERLYVPVYQAPPPIRYTPSPVVNSLNPLPKWALVPQKATPIPPSLLKTALNTLPKSAKPVIVNAPAAVKPNIKPVTVRTKPLTVGQETKPLSASPVVSPATLPKRPTTTASDSSSGQEVVAILSPSHVPSYILEGLLELGNKSAALFNIDGLTRRVNVGDSIGSSGWTLVDVSNGEAIIRRNGEVRSVYTGQRF